MELILDHAHLERSLSLWRERDQVTAIAEDALGLQEAVGGQASQQMAPCAHLGDPVGGGEVAVADH